MQLGRSRWRTRARFPAAQGGGPFAEFPVFQAAYASGYALISIIGDSTTLGVGSGTANVGTFKVLGADLYSPAKYLADALTAAGYNAITNCWKFANSNLSGLTIAQVGTYYDPAVTVTGSFTFGTGATAYGGSFAITSAAGTLVATPTGSYDRIQTFYNGYSTSGTFNLIRGGSTLATVTTTRGSNTFVAETTSVALASGALTLSRASGQIVPNAMRVWNSTVQTIQVEQLGVSSWTTASWIVATNPWSPLPAIDSIGADLFIINLGLNDEFFGLSVADTKANLKTIINRCLATGANVLVALATGSSGTHNMSDARRTAVTEACSECGIGAPIDLRPLVQPVGNSLNPTDYDDTVHLKAPGSQKVANGYAARVIG